jgi:hypothetical protein
LRDDRDTGRLRDDKDPGRLGADVDSYRPGARRYVVFTRITSHELMS